MNRVFGSDTVGLGRQGVENLLPYGAMVFNAFGPRNAHFEAVMAEAAKVVPWINAQCAREALSPAGLGAIIWAAVDAGEITAEEAPLLVRSLLSAGLDTTIVGIGNALYAFATNPAQWQALREKPALVRPAFAGAALGVADPDVLPHHHPRGRHRQGRNSAGCEGITVPGLC
ncbi:MAG: hypothetical protein WAV38_20640 [Xanthobacteraceae bacterium]